jgi:glutamate formiminotransferase / formiminotetrahydrofolate cyclodeaminase
VLARLPEVIDLAAEIGAIGNQNSLSDAGVAVLCASAGAEGAYYNVLINLAALAALDQSEEPEFLARTRQEATALMQTCDTQATAARRTIRGKLEAAL